MMSPNQTQKKQRQIVDDHVGKMDARTKAAQKKMWSKIMEVIRKLEIDQSGNIKANTANIRAMRTIKADIKKSVLTKGYKQGVKTFLKGFEAIKKDADKYLNAEAQRE